MGLYKQSRSKYWWMRFTNEHGVLTRRSTGTCNENAATIIMAKELKAVEQRGLGITAPSPLAGSQPIKRIVDLFLKEQRLLGISEPWIDTQQKRFDKMIYTMRLGTLRDITTNGLKQYLAEQLGEMSHTTRKQYIMHMRKLCEWAMEQSPPLLGFNPAIAASPRLSGRRSRVEDNRETRRPLWSSEIPQLLNATPDTPRELLTWERHRRPIYVVAMRTGFRRSTLNRLRPASIHLDVANPHILVPAELTKSGRSIVMDLVDETVIGCVEQLLGLAAARRKSDRFYGLPFAPVPKPDTFRRDLIRAGIPPVDELGRKVVFHSLRSTFCTQLAIRGVPAQVAMQLMDHTSIHTTMKFYTLVGQTDMRRFMSDLPKLGIDRDSLCMSQSMSVG